MASANISREIDLDFDVPAVKDSIDKVCKIAGYAVHNKNEILNTYRIGKMEGLESVSMNITLKKVGEYQSIIKVDVHEPVRGQGHASVINRVIDNFLDRLSKALTGQDDEEIKKAASTGCFGVLAVILFLVLVSLSLSAQQYKYGQLLFVSKGMTVKMMANIDTGYYTAEEFNKSGMADRFIRDANGKERQFKSHIEAINFLASLGWELFIVYPSPAAGEQYFLRKPIR